MVNLIPDPLVRQMAAIDAELQNLWQRILDEDPSALNDFHVVKLDLDELRMAALKKRIPEYIQEELNLASQDLSRAVRFGKFTENAAKAIKEARKKISKLITK